MTTKLTLSMDKKTISRAKDIAQNRGKSLSKMVEEYFNSIPDKKEKEGSIVERLQNRTKPYLEKLKLPEGADYTKIAREMKYKDIMK